MCLCPLSWDEQLLLSSEGVAAAAHKAPSVLETRARSPAKAVCLCWLAESGTLGLAEPNRGATTLCSSPSLPTSLAVSFQFVWNGGGKGLSRCRWGCSVQRHPGVLHQCTDVIRVLWPHLGGAREQQWEQMPTRRRSGVMAACQHRESCCPAGPGEWLLAVLGVWAAPELDLRAGTAPPAWRTARSRHCLLYSCSLTLPWE